MLVVHRDALFEEHETPEGHPECPERLPFLLDGLRRARGVAAWRDAVQVSDPTARAAAVQDLARVHDPAYVRAIEALAGEGGGALDADTWISPRSYDAALAAVATLTRATDECLASQGREDPARRAFTALRPPGHHARPAKAMGFCLFNQVAVAAARAVEVQGLDRVAVVDFDVHHGNGTQEAFYERGEVLFVSLHRDRFYPGSGDASEIGQGAGKGATLNVPLTYGTPPSGYQEALRGALDRVAGFEPQLLLISAGFDAYRDDPVGDLGLEVEHFRWIGEELRRLAEDRCEGRAVASLEGGYALDALGDLGQAFVEGFAE
jgi:acetoin utilization deacetylase AcuC-like enzyme